MRVCSATIYDQQDTFSRSNTRINKKWKYNRSVKNFEYRSGEYDATSGLANCTTKATFQTITDRYMDFKIAKLDGLDILLDSASGIYYTSKEWRRITTDDTSTNIAGYHGRNVSPTFARKRVITLEGIIQRI